MDQYQHGVVLYIYRINGLVLNGQVMEGVRLWLYGNKAQI